MKYLKNLCFWFLKKFPLSEDQMCELNVLAFQLYDLDPSSKTTETELFSRLAKVEGFNDYLRDTMNRDIRRNFNASSPIEQFTTKGGYARTVYFKSLLKQKPAQEVEKIKKPAKLGKTSRYAQ